MKKLFLLLFSVMLLGCSYIDKMEIADVNTVETQLIINEEYPNGVWYIYFYTNNVLTNTVYLPLPTNGENGQDGVDGQDGANGTNGQDGQDGQNGANGADGANGSTIDIQYTETGIVIILTQPNGDITYWYLNDGQNGTNGTDGQDGTNGQDGSNGQDGQDGSNGSNGSDGYNSIVRLYQDGNCVVIIAGLDLNRNNILDEEEITDMEQLCDCNLNPCEQDCDDDEGDPKKVELCHKTKIGNDWNYFTIYVPQSAVQAHLNHGDNLGSCEN